MIRRPKGFVCGKGVGKEERKGKDDGRGWGAGEGFAEHEKQQIKEEAFFWGGNIDP